MRGRGQPGCRAVRQSQVQAGRSRGKEVVNKLVNLRIVDRDFRGEIRQEDQRIFLAFDVRLSQVGCLNCGANVGSPITSRFFAKPGNPPGELSFRESLRQLVRMHNSELPAEFEQNAEQLGLR